VTEAQEKRVRVYSSGGSAGRRFYACYRPTGRSRFLAREEIDTSVGGFKIRGRFLKYENGSDGRYGDVDLEVVVTDASTGLDEARWSFASYRAGDLPPIGLGVLGERLRGDGAYAFLVSGVDETVGGPRAYEVHWAHEPRQRMLARSETIDPNSFDASGDFIRWRDGDREHLMPFH
jgi:hypothetical protein